MAGDFDGVLAVLKEPGSHLPLSALGLLHRGVLAAGRTRLRRDRIDARDHRIERERRGRSVAEALLDVDHQQRPLRGHYRRTGTSTLFSSGPTRTTRKVCVKVWPPTSSTTR